MTTLPSLAEANKGQRDDGLRIEVGPGERLRRLERRRRLLREQLLVAAVLLLILAVTVAVLATQWLSSSPPESGRAALPFVTAV